MLVEVLERVAGVEEEGAVGEAWVRVGRRVVGRLEERLDSRVESPEVRDGRRTSGDEVGVAGSVEVASASRVGSARMGELLLARSIRTSGTTGISASSSYTSSSGSLSPSSLS